MSMCSDLGRERNEIVKGVVRRSGLRNFVVRLRFHRVNQIGKLDRVLNEEDRDVVADEIEDAFVGVELDREPAHVPREIGRAARTSDGGEAHKDRRLAATDR